MQMSKEWRYKNHYVVILVRRKANETISRNLSSSRYTSMIYIMDTTLVSK